MNDFQSQNDRGKGALFRIPEDQRKSDKYPTYRGDLSLPDGSRWKLAGWVKPDKNGKPYLSLSAEPFEKRQQPDRDHQRSLDALRQGGGRMPIEDKIPFQADR